MVAHRLLEIDENKGGVASNTIHWHALHISIASAVEKITKRHFFGGFSVLFTNKHDSSNQIISSIEILFICANLRVWKPLFEVKIAEKLKSS